jgi:glycogen(starch) synthase
MRVLILNAAAQRALPLSAALRQAGHDAVVHTGPATAPAGSFDLALVASVRLRSAAIRSFGVPPDRVHPIPPAVDPSAWRAPVRAVTAARLRFAGEGPMVAYAGSLVPTSGVPDLVEALPVLRMHHPGLRAVVAGSGPARADILDAVRRHRLYRAVTLTGTVGPTELAAIFGAADAVVVPNRLPSSALGTPAGVTAIEAAAAGAPVAAADTVAFVEPGVTGVTFPAGRPGELAGAVDTLLDDRDLAAKLASVARLTVEQRLSWPTVAAHLVRTHTASLTSRLCV